MHLSKINDFSECNFDDHYYGSENEIVFVYICKQTNIQSNKKHPKYLIDFIQFVKNTGINNFRSTELKKFKRCQINICVYSFGLIFQFKFNKCEIGECNHSKFKKLAKIFQFFPLEIVHYIDSFINCETNFDDFD